jgi:hypothetical protein
VNEEARIRHNRKNAVQRAGELARSGLYENWQAIQEALVGEGFIEAPEALRSVYLRMILEDHCAAARRKAP